MWILLPLATFVLSVVLHGLVVRVPMEMDSVRRYLLVGLPLGVLHVLASLYFLEPPIVCAAAILLYMLLCEFYIFLFTLVIGSVSVALLLELQKGPLDHASMSVRLDPREMVQLRVIRLTRTGFALEEGGRFSVTQKGEKLHRIFSALRCFFGHSRR